MKREKLFEYFLQGITVIVTLYEISRTGIVTLYEISRTGKRSRRK